MEINYNWNNKFFDFVSDRRNYFVSFAKLCKPDCWAKNTSSDRFKKTKNIVSQQQFCHNRKKQAKFEEPRTYQMLVLSFDNETKSGYLTSPSMHAD